MTSLMRFRRSMKTGSSCCESAFLVKRSNHAQPDWQDPLKNRETVVRVVDNRVMVLGLDYLYRESMKQVESTKLLECARQVAKRLHIHPSDIPVEGYYAESPELREYFKLMRALQERPEEDEDRVKQ